VPSERHAVTPPPITSLTEGARLPHSESEVVSHGSGGIGSQRNAHGRLRAASVRCVVWAADANWPGRRYPNGRPEGRGDHIACTRIATHRLENDVSRPSVSLTTPARARLERRTWRPHPTAARQHFIFRGWPPGHSD
jgi:hypothetical protein